uniref:Cytokine receptor like factor 3 n=1 Tax=Strigops habroptila TaxID=2489341 RepID=A0A672VCK8_STRHB
MCGPSGGEARPPPRPAPRGASPPRLPMEADAETEVRFLLQEARESIEAARSYRRELEQRLRGLHQARKQIRESATLTRDVLEQHFNDLKGTLKKLLDERLMSLLQEVDAIEQESIKPLDECQKLIEHGVSTADDLLREGESAVHGDVGQQNEKLCIFTKKALHIQLDRSALLG